MVFESKYKFILVLFVFLVFSGNLSESEAQQISLEIQGSIVMYDPPGFLSNTNGAISTYVVRISEVLSGKESSQYILILTTHKFSKSQFNLKKVQQFKLIRSSGWDDKISNKVNSIDTMDKRKNTTRLILSKGVKPEDIPLNETLPCYIFRGNDYPNKWWLKSKKPS